MHRLMSAIESGRADSRDLLTQRFKPDRIKEAYELFAGERGGVLKMAITP
jgi:threonine dehydrogenase-like Zn-dependent dehydrogenase